MAPSRREFPQAFADSQLPPDPTDTLADFPSGDTLPQSFPLDLTQDSQADQTFHAPPDRNMVDPPNPWQALVRAREEVMPSASVPVQHSALAYANVKAALQQEPTQPNMKGGASAAAASNDHQVHRVHPSSRERINVKSAVQHDAALEEKDRSRSPARSAQRTHKTKTTSEDLFMVATSEWERWEDVPIGIQQGFVDKLASRFKVRMHELPPQQTTYKMTMEVKCGSKTTTQKPLPIK